MYVRCSTAEQNEARQLKIAEELNIDKENIYIDKQSGKNADRNALKELLKFARKGDTIYCESISRIARNTKDLLNIIEDLQKRGIDFVSQKENIDTATPQGRFILTIFGALAELERECILQKQAEGIAIAKSEGKYKGRKRTDINEAKFLRMCAEWRKGEITAVSIQKEFGITAPTFYRWVKDRNI